MEAWKSTASITEPRFHRFCFSVRREAFDVMQMLALGQMRLILKVLHVEN